MLVFVFVKQQVGYGFKRYGFGEIFLKRVQKRSFAGVGGTQLELRKRGNRSYKIVQFCRKNLDRICGNFEV